jgi:hypothetical protein
MGFVGDACHSYCLAKLNTNKGGAGYFDVFGLVSLHKNPPLLCIFLYYMDLLYMRDFGKMKKQNLYFAINL